MFFFKGKIGGRAIAFFMSTTLIAVVIGIVLVTTIKPGKKYNTSNVLFFGKTENEIFFLDFELLVWTEKEKRAARSIEMKRKKPKLSFFLSLFVAQT